MPLSKQPISVPFIGGIDRAGDSFTVIPTKLQTLENMMFEKESPTKSLLKRRPGFASACNTAYAGTTALPGGGFLDFAKLGQEALLETTSGIYSLNVNDDKCLLRNARFNRMAPNLTSIRHTDKNVTEFDFATINGYDCYIWTETVADGAGLTSGQIWVMVKDSRNGQVLLLTRPEIAGAAATFQQPRVVIMQGNGTSFTVASKFFCYYAGDNKAGLSSIKGFTINMANPTAISAVNTVALNVTDTPWDVAVSNQYDPVVGDFGDRYPFIVFHTTGVIITFAILNATDGFTIVNSINRNIGVTALHMTAECVGVQGGIPGPADSQFNAIWHANGNLQCSYTDMNFAATANTVVSTTAANIGRVTTWNVPGTFTIECWFDVTTAAGAQNMYTKLQSVTFTAVGGISVAEATVVRSVGLGTRAWVDLTDNKRYVGVYVYSDSQPTFYVVELGATLNSLEVVARSSPSQCGRIVSMWTRRQRVGTPGWRSTKTWGNYLTLNQILIHNTGETVLVGVNAGLGPVNVTPTGVSQLDLYRDNDYQYCGPIGTCEMAGSLVYAGACPSQFDGQTLSELGFHYYPEGLSAGVQASAGSRPGTYSFIVVYEWIDATGKTHRSGTSLPFAQTLGANQDSVLTVPTLRLTRKQQVKIVIYRTTAGGTIYYRVSRVTAGLPELVNDPTVDTVQFIDTTTDANLLTGEFLYTTGGVLDNEPYPAAKHVSTFQDRLFFSGHERKHLIQYTEQRDEFFFPAHSEFYSMFVPEAGRRAVATAALDDNKLCVVQEQSIGVVFGTGPNRLGLENGYSEVQTIVKDIGCPWANSGAVITDEFGVWFPTLYGLRHFNKGLALTVGQDGTAAGLEVGQDLIPRKAVRVPKKTQLYFYCPDQGSILAVWDYAVQQWSRFTIQAKTGVFVPRDEASRLDAVHLFFTAGFNVVRKFTGTDDAANPIVSTIETAWIKMSELQGFERLYSVTLLGKYAGSGNFTIECGYDYDETTYTAPVGMNPTSGQFTAGKPFQVQHKPARQKCEAIRFRIKESASTAGSSFTGLELLVGVKPGIFKIDSGKRV